MRSVPKEAPKTGSLVLYYTAIYALKLYFDIYGHFRIPINFQIVVRRSNTMWPQELGGFPLVR